LSYGRYAGISSPDPRTHSNNMYIEMLAGGGVLVGAAFAWLVWRVARAARASLGVLDAVRASRAGAARMGPALGVAAATLAIAVHGTADSFLGFSPTYVLFSLTLGCAVACARGAETSRANRV
jgi:hypothetical protein